MLELKIVFMGLIALVFPDRSRTHAEARAIWVPAFGHFAYIDVSDGGYVGGASTTPDGWWKDVDGTKWWRWTVPASVVTTDSTDSSITVVGDLEDKMIDPQGASPTPPDITDNWKHMPAFRVTGGKFGYTKVIQSHSGDQVWAYAAKQPDGTMKPGSKVHAATAAFEYTTKASKILFDGGHQGTILLVKDARVNFLNEGGNVGAYGAPNPHYVDYWKAFFPSIKEKDRYLPYETLAFDVKNPVEAQEFHPSKGKSINPKMTIIPKAPDRCPPPKAYVKYN